MTTAPELPSADSNRRVLRGWIDRWTPLVNAAAKAFAPVYERLPVRSGSIDEDLAVANRAQTKILEGLSLGREGHR